MESLDVYVGVWQDHSAPRFGGLVWTLPIWEASIIISLLTSLLTIAVASCWTIAAYTFHQILVARNAENPVDPLFLQIQVLLRNIGSPNTALWDLLRIYWAWRKSTAHRRRLLTSVAVIAGILALGALPASALIASITTKTADAVLVLAKPKACGYLKDNFSVGGSNDIFAATYNYTTAKALRGRAYAKQWYGGDTAQHGLTSYFPLPRLPYDTYTVPCPFGRQKCRYDISDTDSADRAIVFDTRLLDSASHLGVNGPGNRTIRFRKRTTCSPTRTGDLWGSYEEGSETYTVLRAGLWEGPGDITLKFNTKIRDLNVGYITGQIRGEGSQRYSYHPRSMAAGASIRPRRFTPHSSRHPYHRRIFGPVRDPVFPATGRNNRTAQGKTVYTTDYFVTTLVCLDQVQYCNPNNGICTSLTNPVHAAEEGKSDLDLNEQQLGLLRRVGTSIVESTVFQSGIASLGSAGLRASEFVYNNALSAPLPDDQWIREVTLWFQTGLSILQEQIVQFLDITLYNNSSDAFILLPTEILPDKERAQSEWQCAVQKIRSQGQFQNFNLTVLIIIAAIALLIIIISLVLETGVKYIRKKFKFSSNTAQFTRSTDNLYWLLHAALLGGGVGDWKYGDNDQLEGVDIPISTVTVSTWPTKGVKPSRPFYKLR
ncbi:hypothetical protein ABW20_dc0100483 [Dactylellina cionopaga]|nr:hypothetical protein ABW20_dc0100483 [Dactylellina cionopaga]